MAIACLFGVILSISALYGQLGKRQLGKCLPLSIGTVIAVMYTAALAGFLRAGVFVVLALGAVSGVLALLIAVNHKELRKLSAGFFTPSMAIYYALCAMIFIANKGKPVKTWDEFTYWADAVKIMTQLKVLPTDPAARSLFASYPPALPLWQYLLQEINSIVAGQAIYAESLLFMSYQWFLVALYIPFTSRFTWRKPIEIILCSILIPLAALSVFPQAFNQLHSDALLGTLGGFVCARAFFSRKKDWFDIAGQMIMLFVLVLVKDAGLLFAIAGVCMAVFDWNFAAEKKRQWIWYVVMCSLAVIAARLSWSIHVEHTGAAAQATFDDPISLKVLLDPSQHWRITTLRNFIYQFFELIFPVQGISVNISYFMAFVMLGVASFAVHASLKSREEAKRYKWLCAVLFGAAFLYICGTGLTYVFKFYEDEAVRMASYDRYLNIAVMFCVFVLFVCLIQMGLTEWSGGLNKRVMVGALALFLLFAPCTRLLDMVSRLDAQHARQQQEAFLELEQKVFSVAEENDRIYLIAAGSGGFERIVMRYRLRPLYVGDEPWNIGMNMDEDRFTTYRTLEDWKQCLMENYDLLVICALTPEFSQAYGELFENPETINVGQIYRVNKSTGLLQSVV